VAIIAKVERNISNGDIYGDPLPPMQLSWSSTISDEKNN
jgi:hypothetical protein